MDKEEIYITREIKRCAQNEISKLNQILKVIDNFLSHAPEGSLKSQKIDDKVYYE